jgi:DNA helicase IV
VIDEIKVINTDTAKDYSAMNVSTLKDLCRAKGLSVKGTKQELIDRLRSNVA